jgi:hypothetical protein
LNGFYFRGEDNRWAHEQRELKMTFEHDQRETSMTETELSRIRQSIWERSVRALYDSFSLSSLDPVRAAAVAKLLDDVKTLVRKVFRTVHVVEPGELNLDLYLNEHEVFIEDLACYSVKLIRNQVKREYLLDDQDLAALPKLLCDKEPR